MPEYPDVTVYVDALKARLVGRTLRRVRLASPFLLRSVDPPIEAAEGRRIADVRRLGKRIVVGLEGDLFLVPDRRARARRPLALPPAQGRLAAFAGRAMRNPALFMSGDERRDFHPSLSFF